MNKIFARKTNVQQVSREETLSFLNENHRQRAPKIPLSAICLGLYYNGDLVAAVVFAVPRTSGMKRDYSFELLRLAFKRNVRVVGGASKLISHYIKTYKPADFFTYQDTTGETTDVYEKAGMRFVREEKKKQYLVTPGKTRENADKKECFSIASVVMRGPDALLGTTLGEVRRENGKRKTNPEIFLEDLGWHIEETSGDRIYEWINPNRTYYTYKITASDSEKYYIGVSHVKKHSASIEDCLNDGYMGSGGRNPQNKFFNWSNKHRENLHKEIISIHESARQAYSEEKRLIGTKYKDDPNCMNSTSGGKDGGLLVQKSLDSRGVKNCKIHGFVKHQGDSCLSCSASGRYRIENCPIHGAAKHTRNGCLTCQLRRAIITRVCSVHGETTFKGGNCVSCTNQKNVKEKKCETHGTTKHLGDKCYKCLGESKKAFTENNCPIHGQTTFRGEKCAKCLALKVFSVKECARHGNVTFRGDKCVSCTVEKTLKTFDCAVHGTVKTQNGECPRCRGKKIFSKKACSKHGVTTFRNGSCLACQKSI